VQSHILLDKIIDCFLTPVKTDVENDALSDGEIPDQKPQGNYV